MTASSPASLHNLILSLPATLDDAVVSAFGPVLLERALSTSMMRENNSHTGPWNITWLFDQLPDNAEIEWLLQDAAAEAGITLGNKDWRVESVADVNWLEHSYKQFQPFSIGDFFIYGSHYEDAPPKGSIPLLIDAATAFGSGEHGTTAGCLRALLLLRDKGYKARKILDMGTGSGILAVAAAKLWDVPVLAVDIEEESVIVSARHAAANGVSALVDCHHGDGFRAFSVTDNAPFDLILANILAGPLVAMAPALTAVLAPAGYVILSGMLSEQTAEVQAAYEENGCRARELFTASSWDALLLEKTVRLELVGKSAV